MVRERLGTPAITQLFLLWGLGIAHCLQGTVMFMANSMLLWWTSDSVVLPVVIKPKVVTEALQWSGDRRCKVTPVKPN